MIHTKIWSKLFFVITLVAITKNSQAQPNWNVDPALYEYTMTLTGVAIIQCQESRDERDLVAAFIDGAVRGVQRFDGVGNNRNYAYMVIYDSIFTGNQVRFKLYDASQDKIIDISQNILFAENSNVGSDEHPFAFETDAEPLQLTMSKSTVYKFANLGDTLLQLGTTNVLQDTLESEYRFLDDTLGLDNHYFKIHDHFLVLNEAIDQHNRADLHIHLIAETSSGCLKDSSFVLNISEVVATNQTDSKIESNAYVYPNPASEYIYLMHLSDTHWVELYDPIKNRYLPVHFESDNRIAIAHLSSQIYYLLINSETGLQWIRFAVIGAK